jgi:hypothetical protein
MSTSCSHVIKLSAHTLLWQHCGLTQAFMLFAQPMVSNKVVPRQQGVNKLFSRHIFSRHQVVGADIVLAASSCHQVVGTDVNHAAALFPQHQFVGAGVPQHQGVNKLFPHHQVVRADVVLAASSCCQVVGAEVDHVASSSDIKGVVSTNKGIGNLASFPRHQFMGADVNPAASSCPVTSRGQQVVPTSSSCRRR